MKIIFDYRVLTHKTYTGVENYAKNIFENLKNRCDLNIAKPKSTNKYLAHLWTHFILPFKSGDVLFCPANIAPLFLPKSKKLVVTIHDVAFLAYPKSFSVFFRVYYKMIIPRVIKRADAIITVSEFSKNEIEIFYPEAKEKIKVIYQGYDVAFKKLETSKKKDQILYVGSMNERKNFIAVLKAFELLNQNDYKLIIVGNFSNNFSIDKDSMRILKRASRNPKIEFKLNVERDDLIKIYNESKLLLFPSFYEGFGLPVLEAMACGVPAVCSGSSSLPEVGGDAVLYCDPRDIDDMQDKIKKVLTDDSLQKQMIDQGLLRSELFSWDRCTNEHIRVCKRVFER